MSDFAHNVAVIIGINDYQNGIPQLQTAVEDAKTLAHLLEHKHGYTVSLYVDEQASLDGLNHIFQAQLPKLIGEGDRLLLYFAGHGIALDGDDGPAGYLIPQDARPAESQSFLSMQVLHDALASLPCRHFLGIFDCCFAWAFRWASTRDIGFVPAVIHQERFDRFIEDAAWQVITSASHNQKALDVLAVGDQRGQIGHHSPFAQGLIDALQGKADALPVAQEGRPAGDGIITATELYHYLRDSVEIFNPNGRHLATAGYDGIARGSFYEDELEGIIYLWNVADLSIEDSTAFAQSGGHIDSVRDVKFSPTDNGLLGSAGKDCTVRLWSVAYGESCQEISSLDGHANEVWSIDFAPDGQSVLTSSTDSVAILWDLQGRSITCLSGHEGTIWSARFNPVDKELLATAGLDGDVRLWDIGEKFVEPKFDFRTRIRDIDFSQSVNRLAVGGSDGTVRFWDWKDSVQEVKEIPSSACRGNSGSVYGVSLSPNGSTLAAAVEDGQLYVWDITDEDGCLLRGSWRANKGKVHRVEFSAQDDNVLATIGEDGSIRLWNLADEALWTQGQNPLPAFQGHQGEGWDISFSHNGQLMATVGTDATVRVWDITHLLNQLSEYKPRHDTPIPISQPP